MDNSAKLSTSSPLDAPTDAIDKTTKPKDVKYVRYTFDPANPPPLSEAQKAELRALATMSDDDIDYSDIPRLPEGAWKNAIRGRFYRPVKQQVTVRLDADVVSWLKSQGKGYQSRMNAILRHEMLALRTKPAE